MILIDGKMEKMTKPEEPGWFKLKEVLPVDFLNEYIDDEHLLKFENELAGILRWQDENSEFYKKEENVLEHVVEMLKIASRIGEEYPGLASVINFKRLRLMIVMHDMGESLRGDRPYTVDAQATTDERRKAKFSERLWGKRLLKRLRRSEELIEIYEEQGRRDEGDIEAWITRVIDVAQAEQFGAETGLFKARVEHNAPGYKGTGNTPSPDYYWFLINSAENALRLNKAGHSAISDFQKLIKTEFLSDSALAEHYQPEDIEELRRQFSTE